jgi:hypothetical protein
MHVLGPKTCRKVEFHRGGRDFGITNLCALFRVVALSGACENVAGQVKSFDFLRPSPPFEGSNSGIKISQKAQGIIRAANKGRVALLKREQVRN